MLRNACVRYIKMLWQCDVETMWCHVVRSRQCDVMWCHVRSWCHVMSCCDIVMDKPTVHVDRKQNMKKLCFFKKVICFTKQNTDFFLCQINVIAKKQQFSSAKVSGIFRKRRHITFSQRTNKLTENFLYGQLLNERRHS